MNTIFFTGFPGFLGAELLPEILKRSKENEALCLVQPKYFRDAERKSAEIVGGNPALTGRIRLIRGDITLPGMGLDDSFTQEENIVEIFHFAAVYDLSISRELARNINVYGTKNVIELAQKCKSLKRFHYVSTCYVSGRYCGPFSEKDLKKGQTFDNHYESTKYLAEVEVQDAMKDGLPTTIYRPAIVVGDSKTGKTQKYDGPYYVLAWLLKQKYVAFMPSIGDPAMCRINVVPSDFITKSINYLSSREDTKGKVFQLCDHEPLTIDETLNLYAQATKRYMIRIPLPLWLAKFALKHIGFVYKLLGIPAEAVDYYVKPTHYVNDETRKYLEEGNISCPSIRTYARTLVNYMEQNKGVSSKAMI